MLTQTQRDTFRLALAAVNDFSAEDVNDLDIDDMCADSSVVETAETVEDFFKSCGRKLDRKGNRPDVALELQKTIAGELYVWEKVQRNGNGSARGTLYVMDFGTARAAYFLV